MIPAMASVAVVGGAAMHAAWNVGIRGGPDRRRATAMLLLSAGGIGVMMLPFLMPPASASWWHLGISILLHVLYFNLVAETYLLGEVSLTYPVMRGMAPALVAIIAVFIFGRYMDQLAWVGLMLISGGVLLLARRNGKSGEWHAIGFAVLNALVIALYTINDGFGVRLSHSPVAYALWTFVLPAIPAALILLRGKVRALWQSHDALAAWLKGAGGAVFSVAAYTLALWAMTQAPISAVAALRETSLLFGLIFAWWFLAEQPGMRRIAGAVIILLGAVLIEIG
ncbi:MULTISPECIES: EamA family transporter [Acidithiobacillus]|nr:MULTISPECIES: EamA family transporter [Acidithiobacillus]